MADVLGRLKILINSSTPIVVMETVEEMRAVGMVRVACTDLNMAVFEWSIADGLVRAGNLPAGQSTTMAQTRVDKVTTWTSKDDVAHTTSQMTVNPGGISEDQRLAKAVLSAMGQDSASGGKSAGYNTR